MAGDLKLDCAFRFPGGMTIRPRGLFSGTSGVTAIYGPSGGGKTTLLRLVAGLLRPREGMIISGNETWNDASKGIFVPPQRRKVGMVFQDYALFPHLSVETNIRYAVRLPEESIRKELRRLTEALDIGDLLPRKPHQLSGGQRQRVALARAVIRQPNWLLLDEPMAALDDRTKRKVRDELAQFLGLSGIPSLLVTHHPEDLASLADHVAVVDKGHILQHGTTADVLARPRNASVAEILGYENIFSDSGDLSSVLRNLFSANPGSGTPQGIAFRARSVKCVPAGADVNSAAHRLPGDITRIDQGEAFFRLTFQGENFSLQAIALEAPAYTKAEAIIPFEAIRFLGP